MGITIPASSPVGTWRFDWLDQRGRSIVAAWQAGATNRETRLDVFRRGEVLPEGRTNEEEVKVQAVSPMVRTVHGSHR